MENTKLILTENQKSLMLKCLNDFYEMHLDLAQDEDCFGFEGEQKFSEECYGVAHSMIGYLKEFNSLDLDTSFKCNIANISIDHYFDDVPYKAEFTQKHKMLKRLQDEIQTIWDKE